MTKKLLDATDKNDLAGYSELLQRLFVSRGIVTREDAEKFLSPSYDDLSDPFTLHDMHIAVDRILSAIKNGERIVVYADYDADGVPGAVVLHDFFKKITYDNVHIYIPHRHKEGYGLHNEAIDTLAEEQTDLIITVDLGIGAVDAVAHAKDLGIDVIVTDHHLPGEILPEAIAVVNPKLGGYTDPMLCGAAVAFQLVRGLNIRLDPDEKEGLLQWTKWLLDMVGIATISDMVPLQNENRIFASFGLRVLKKSRRLGLVKLLQRVGVSQAYLVEEDIGFTISPRLNAASRMSHPMEAFRLLATTDPEEADMQVEHLLLANDDRKKEVAKIMKAVKKKLSARELAEVIVVGDPAWNLGVVGLVASKISEQYNKPSFVWGAMGQYYKGSCRSDGVCNLYELMAHIDDGVFAKRGGHAEAGGFGVLHEHIHFLEQKLSAGYAELYPDGVTEKLGEVDFDMELEIGQVTTTTYNEIQKLAPFGEGNPKPVFLFKNVLIQDVRLFGKGKDHLEITVADGDGAAAGTPTPRAIAFFTVPQDYDCPVEKGATINLYASIEMNRFRGASELRLKIVDIQK